MARRPKWWLTILAKIWPITWISAKATTWRGVGPLVEKLALPLFSGKNLNITYIPIDKQVHPGSTSLLPIRLVEALIDRSAHRAIIHRCTCRDARHCRNHPVELGCMFLGQDARKIDPRIARHVSKSEAIEHLHKAVHHGLTPMIGHDSHVINLTSFLPGPYGNKFMATFPLRHIRLSIISSLNPLTV